MTSKLTPETQERICQLLRAGNTVEVAAEASGIARRTFYSWRTSNPEFAAAVEQAEAQAEATMVARMMKAANGGSVRALGWLLERRYPDRWAPAKDRPDRSADPEVATTFEGLYAVSKPREAG